MNHPIKRDHSRFRKIIKGKIRDKVLLVDEAQQQDYDGEYYIQHQIIPGIEKIFAVLGINVDDLTSDTKQEGLSKFL